MKSLNKSLLRMIRITFLAVISLVLAIFLIKSADYSGLELVFMDVGQGDASLIKTPSGHTILIDGGPDNKVLRGLGKNMPFYRRRLDYLIISHYHDDHITGLIEIMKRYRVRTLIYSGQTIDSALLAELLQTASLYRVKLQIIESQAELAFSQNCRLRLLNPVILGVKDDPNNSLTASLDCAAKHFLFAGDNNEKLEAAFLVSGWPLKADIFKASHHGSNSSNGLAFLEAVAPRLIVVSVGADNRFGHPGPFFIDRAASLNIPVKRTDKEGDIKIFVK